MTETDNTDSTLLLHHHIPIFLSFSFSRVIPSVINLFKKNIHSLFNLTTTITTAQSHSISGLSLVTAIVDQLPVPNVLESIMLNSNSKQRIIENFTNPIEFVSGDVDGLMSCTESLGFESSDERRVCDGMDVKVNSYENDEIWRRKMMMKKAESRGNWLRSFPPLIPSLNRNGRPSFYLRPVRKDGRLELTEVRIHRPDIIHASRHDGRLTLHLIPDRESEEEEEDDDIEDEFEEEEEEEENMGMSMVVGNSNEGLRRCHEMVNQQHLLVHGNHIRMCV